MLNFRFKINKKTKQKYLETAMEGKALLTIPQLNKGTAFTPEEREIFHLTGKLPTHIETLDEQVKRAYWQYKMYTTPLQKNVYLNHLHNTNMILFYKLVADHLGEMIPILYTPTVGTAVIKFSREFNQARGLYISYEHQNIIEKIIDNRSHPDIDLIVVTDGDGVLGIGDQGVGAMLIPVAKLMVYTICGGINPYRTLPIMLDVGTNNKHLQNDFHYLGWRHHRITGKNYDTFIAKFVTAIKRKLPQAFLHWEDFGRDNAQKILDTYRNQLCTFNDDVQGTGTVTLAALLTAIKIKKSTLKEQRIVIYGAGTAGIGITTHIYEAMLREGLSEDEARRCFWLIDKSGLLTENSNDLTVSQRPYARTNANIERWSQRTTIGLLEVIKHVKPTVLIGCSACTSAFNKTVVQTMATQVEYPIIFPLSNPTEKAEATPNDLIHWTNNKALIATGSPFDPVTYHGKTIHIAQCNNALIFPGLGLGVIAVKATRVSDEMLWAACQALANHTISKQNTTLSLLPSLNHARHVAREIAIAVAGFAVKNGLVNEKPSQPIDELIDQCLWSPSYLPYRKGY